MPNPPVPLGYSPVLPGQLANVVTCLEMLAAPPQRPDSGFPAPYALVRSPSPDMAAYRALFRRIGERWLWYSRLVMPDAQLAAILANPAVEVFVLRAEGQDLGLLELDFRQMPDCELAFFGLAPEAIGGGLGRTLMNVALRRVWERPIRRLWVHTCNFDHPAALGFYIRSGFRPYAYQIEVQPDPRLTGHLPRDAAPQVPIIA